MAADAARAIIERRHQAGTLLTEVGLAAAQGVSRTPAREAMLQLHAWGLVRLLPKKGAIVSEATAEERRDLLALRAMLEIEAVRALASGTGDATGLDADIDAILNRQRESLRSADILDFAGADYAFHARIIQSGGNRIVAELLDTLGSRWARLTYRAVTENPSRLEALLREHEGLAEHARSGDVEGFADLVRRHIEHGHFPDGGHP